MHFLTRVSSNTNELNVASELLATLPTNNLTGVICYYTQEYNAEALRIEFSNYLPSSTNVIGASTCKGVMTETGLHWGPVVAIMAIYDSNSSSYGCALAEYDNDSVNELTIETLEKALKLAEREGEVPEFIVVHATPGLEEALIDAIDSTFHIPVPIIGGSAADNEIQGNWSVFNQENSTNSGIAILVFYPSEHVSTSFSAGYSPTEFSGTITKSIGSEVHEIDGQSAQQVYREWIGDHAGVTVPKHFVFELVTQYPLGRIAGSIYDQPYYKLAHPIRVCEEHDALLFFSDINQGDVVTLMSGSRQQLLGRGARVLREANRQNHFKTNTLGNLCIMCAGSMLYLGDDMQLVYDNIKDEIQNTPFICPFTFGEQGRFIGGENGHGNLMISAARFYSSK